MIVYKKGTEIDFTSVIILQLEGKLDKAVYKH